MLGSPKSSLSKLFQLGKTWSGDRKGCLLSSNKYLLFLPLQKAIRCSPMMRKFLTTDWRPDIQHCLGQTLEEWGSLNITGGQIPWRLRRILRRGHIAFLYGGKYLFFLSSHSVKMRDSSAFSVLYFLRKVCSSFNFWMIKCTENKTWLWISSFEN